MADQYDRMNTNQLEAEADSRGLNLEEFRGLKNNDERAQRLRDHDAARDADAQLAADNAAQAQQQADQQPQDGGADQGRADDSVQVQRDQGQRRESGQGDVGPFDTAPYPSDESRQAAIDAASGNLTTDQSIDPDRAEPVGGQDTGPTPAEQEAQRRSDQNQDR